MKVITDKGISYVVKGDYVEIVSYKHTRCAWLHQTSKGYYFKSKGKRIYIKED